MTDLGHDHSLIYDLRYALAVFNSCCIVQAVFFDTFPDFRVVTMDRPTRIVKPVFFPVALLVLLAVRDCPHHGPRRRSTNHPC